MDFRTVYDRKEIVTCSGEKDRPTYKPEFQSNGTYELVECGVVHSYEDIQSFAPLCDMSQIMERYIKTGDATMLNRRAGFYADVSDLPTDYIALHNLLDNADNVFNALPPDVKEKFGNAPAVFYADKEKADNILSEFIKKKASLAPAPAPAPATVVKKEGVVDVEK